MQKFGPSEGAPEWLLAGVWLCTHDQNYIATAAAEVLPDGHVARVLKIDAVPELLGQIESDLPDIDGRLLARGCDISLEQQLPTPRPPHGLIERSWQEQTLSILVRKVERAKTTHRVACGLLFTTGGGPTILVASDPSCLAMVFSESAPVIAAYLEGCDELALDDYLEQTTT